MQTAILATFDPRRLPGLRRALGVEQRQLARLVNAHPADISKLEKALEAGGLMDRMIDALIGLTVPEQVAPRS